MTDEQKAALHPVENSAPASQESIKGKLTTGEEVEGVRWLDTVTDKMVHQIEFDGKLYLANFVPQENPSEFVFELL